MDRCSGLEDGKPVALFFIAAFGERLLVKIAFIVQRAD
jgi:hypothetical protein